MNSNFTSLSYPRRLHLLLRMYSVWMCKSYVYYITKFSEILVRRLKEQVQRGDSDSEQDTYSFLFGRILCSRIILDIEYSVSHVCL